MRRFLAAFALLASLCQAQDSNARLVATAKLWNYVKYFHPRVTSPDVDWDEAFVRAVPKVLAAASEAEFSHALDEMLGALKDPATHMAVLQPRDSRALLVPKTQNGVTVVSLESGDMNKATELSNSLFRSLQGKGAVVLDLRSPRTAWSLLPSGLPIWKLSVGPGQAVRVHSGYPRDIRPGELGSREPDDYRSTWEIADGDAVAPAVRAANAITPVFLVNRETDIPYLALAAQNSGAGAIVTEDSIGEQYQSLTHSVDVAPGAGLSALVRVREFAYSDGSTGVSANLVLHKTGDEALNAAIEVAKSGKWPPPELRPHLNLPPARFQERSYAETPYPSAELRMLAAARVWGVFHYFHPYAHLYGEDWDQVLAEFLPRMAQAGDAREYHLAVAEMVTHVHDSHSFMDSTELNKFFGAAAPPVEVRPIETQPVVTRVFDAGIAGTIHPGDALVRIDGQPWAGRAAELGKHIAASTPQSMQRDIMRDLLLGPGGSVRLALKNAEGKEYEIELPRTAENLQKLSPYRTGETFKLLTPKIGYVDLDRLTKAEVDAMFEAFKATDAIIMDMRGYPRETAWSIAPRLTEKREPVAALVRRNLVRADNPEGSEIGTLFFEQRLPATDKPPYKGKTVMLIDDRAQSQSEHSGLFYRTAGGTVFIGGPTAGANGDITYFMAPGGIRIFFSGHDIRWADGKQLQRVGLIPDIEAHPTIAGIRAGRDEVLDRAVGFIEKGK
jgi:C-terminal processing protease CtpA/Prc